VVNLTVVDENDTVIHSAHYTSESAVRPAIHTIQYTV